MRQVVSGAFVSLDGVMQAPGGPEEDPTRGFRFGGWTFPYFDGVMGKSMGEQFSQPFDLLLGRKTYDIFAAHWPYQDPTDPIGPVFNRVKKYVATSSREPLTWQNSVAIHDAAADVARLKQEDGPTLLIQGSTQLIQTLLKHDLIDELRLVVIPIVLGNGKRLFGEGTQPVAFKLVSTRTSTTGSIMSTYQRDGAIRTGSFAQQEPSKAELARREQMKREG